MKTLPFLRLAAATLSLLGLFAAAPSQAVSYCNGGQILYYAPTHSMVGCRYDDLGWSRGPACFSDNVTVPTVGDGYCHVCVPPSLVPSVTTGDWSNFQVGSELPADLTCLGCIHPPDGLVGWWPLDEMTNQGWSASPLNYDIWANVTASAAPAPGRVMYSLQLNGTNAYAEVYDVPELNFGSIGSATGDFSFDAWVKVAPGNAGGVRTLIDKRVTSPYYRGYSFFLYNGRPGVQLADGATYGNYIATPAVLADNKWHFVAASVSRVFGARFYIDGAAAGGAISVGQPGSLVNTSVLRLGCHSFDLASCFKGGLDEVEIFNRALEASEMQSIYDAGVYGKCRR
jgi:hypothetical protein